MRDSRGRVDEVVGQDLLPEVDDFLRLGEEAMAADVEQEVACSRTVRLMPPT